MATRTRPREQAPGHVGRSLLRVEDDALLRGQGWFIDDLDPLPNIGCAAIVRSPFAHARIGAIDASAALALPGVIGVVTGADVAAHSRPFASALGPGIVHHAAAVDVARYVGEPVCVVVARDRYIAEDAAERVLVDYEPLPVAASVEAALAEGAPLLHPALGSNVSSDRSFSYGDPEAAFARGRARRARALPPSALLGHAGRVLRRDRPLAGGRGDRLGELPGAVHAARRGGRGARASRARSCGC